MYRFHGPPRKLPHYFSVEHPEEVYPRLAKRASRNWHESWAKHRESYYRAYGPEEDHASEAGDTHSSSATQPLDEGSSSQRLEVEEVAAEEEDEEEEDADGEETRKLEDKLERRRRKKAERKFSRSDGCAGEADATTAGVADQSEQQLWDADGPAAQPGGLTQFFVLVERRFKIFFRDKVQILLHLAMLFGFPLIVILFGLDGIPAAQDLSGGSSFESMKSDVQTKKATFEVGVTISGLVMFQVILLALMGSNNSAREIAAERQIYEKEKLGGTCAV